jgi:murein DD-endopeptidase MepM/ murein hydrolase activator NlpD
MLRLGAFPVRYPKPWQPSRRPPHDLGSTEICISRGYEGHNAVDILGDLGLIVASAVDGTVARVFTDFHGEPHRGTVFLPGGGNIVVIIDTAGFMHYHAHLLKPSSVQAGQRVFAGQQIGLVGRTGRAGPHPHLHYQVSAALADAGPIATNGFSADDRHRVRLERELRQELNRLVNALPHHTDGHGRLALLPDNPLPPRPIDRWDENSIGLLKRP